MTEFEIVFIVLMTAFCGLLLWLYLSLSDNVKNLNKTMLKHLSLNRELVSVLREENEEDDEEDEEDAFERWKQDYAKAQGLPALYKLLYKPDDDDPDPRHKAVSPNLTINANAYYESLNQLIYCKAVIRECIDLLSTDGKGTKQQVKQKLEELLK